MALHDIAVSLDGNTNYKHHPIKDIVACLIG